MRRLTARKVKVAVLQLLRELLQSSQELCPRQTGLWMPMLDITRGPNLVADIANWKMAIEIVDLSTKTSDFP